MDNYTTTEQVYRNGYETGYKEAAKKIAEYLFSICILEDIPHCMEKYFKKQFGVEVKE